MPFIELSIKRKGFDKLNKQFPYYTNVIKNGLRKGSIDTSENLLKSSFEESYNNTDFAHATGNYKSMVRTERENWYRASLVANAKYSDVIEKCRPFRSRGFHIIGRTFNQFKILFPLNYRIVKRSVLIKSRRYLK